MSRRPSFAVPFAAALLGFLTVLALSTQRTPARSARRLELADLVREQDARVLDLQARVSELRARLDELTGGEELAGLEEQVAGLRLRAGPGSVRGPGVVVTLDDSGAARSPTGDPNDLIVHERDIQTVVNALWSAGAEAVGIAGERLTPLSAVRCAGNTLLLHGRVHSPPYRIAAIGDAERIAAALGSQPGMDGLLASVSAFGLGYEVSSGEVRLREAGGAAVAEARPS